VVGGKCARQRSAAQRPPPALPAQTLLPIQHCVRASPLPNMRCWLGPVFREIIAGPRPTLVVGWHWRQARPPNCPRRQQWPTAVPPLLPAGRAAAASAAVAASVWETECWLRCCKYQAWSPECPCRPAAGQCNCQRHVLSSGSGRLRLTAAPPQRCCVSRLSNPFQLDQVSYTPSASHLDKSG
jgi:hypothetical protein